MMIKEEDYGNENEDESKQSREAIEKGKYELNRNYSIDTPTKKIHNNKLSS